MTRINLLQPKAFLLIAHVFLCIFVFTISFASTTIVAEAAITATIIDTQSTSTDEHFCEKQDGQRGGKYDNNCRITKATTTMVLEHDCHLYIAKSSIPGDSGLGVYTAIDLEQNTNLNNNGINDIIIHILDYELHNDYPSSSSSSSFKNVLLNDYVWKTDRIGGRNEASRMKTLIPGLGMLLNSNPPKLNNIKIVVNKKDNNSNNNNSSSSGIKGNDRRSVNPGIGSFSYYDHEHISYYTTKSIKAGSELFIDYGKHWFESRRDKMPVKDKNATVATTRPPIVATTVQVNQNNTCSNNCNSNNTHERSLEWLQDHGICMNYMINPRNNSNDKNNMISLLEVKKSTIKEAGNGLFTTHFIAKGSVMTTTPLLPVYTNSIHNGCSSVTTSSKTNNRGGSILDMYQMILDGPNVGKKVDNGMKKKKFGRQLLLNYCYGHSNSTTLLLPYSSNVHYINHNDNNAYVNTEIAWSADTLLKYKQNNGGWATQAVHDNIVAQENKQQQLQQQPRRNNVMMDYIASRDIEPGEEIFIDYGTKWSDGWKKHVSRWEPPFRPKTYVSADEMNSNNEYFYKMRTYFEEQSEQKYPNNVYIGCYYKFTKSKIVNKSIKKNAGINTTTRSSNATNLFDEDKIINENFAFRWTMEPPDLFNNTEHLHPCKIISREKKRVKITNNTRGNNSSEEPKYFYEYLVLVTERNSHLYDRSQNGQNLLDLLRYINDYDIIVNKSTSSLLSISSSQRFVKNIPRYAIIFIDRPYTSDVHLHNTFRHEIGISDDMFALAPWLSPCH